MSQLSNEVLNHVKLISLTIEQVFGKNSLPYMEEYINHIKNLPISAQEFSIHDEPWNVATNLLGYGNIQNHDEHYEELYRKLMGEIK